MKDRPLKHVYHGEKFEYFQIYLRNLKHLNWNRFVIHHHRTNILIEPELIWLDETWEEDCIRCQSVWSRSLDSIDEWSFHLEFSYHSVYHRIDLTSIRNCSFRWSQMKWLVHQMIKQWKIFSITDLVHNHAANHCALLWNNHPSDA